MCLVVMAIGQHPDFPLILAANRDEFHARPAEQAHWWPDRPNIFGGRDLQAGGTWLAISPGGRFATVTNYQDAKAPSAENRSRGFLVTEFLGSALSPQEYLAGIEQDRYSGFNLIVGTRDQVGYLSNRGDGTRILEPGLYGLSNALLEEAVRPRDVERARESLNQVRQMAMTSQLALGLETAAWVEATGQLTGQETWSSLADMSTTASSPSTIRGTGSSS